MYVAEQRLQPSASGTLSAVAWDSGATPVVLLTKADLCENVATKIAETESVAAGVDIVTTSVIEESGARIAAKMKRFAVMFSP